MTRPGPARAGLRSRSRVARVAASLAVLAAGGALALAGCGSSGASPGASPSASPDGSGTVWLCEPGMSGDPCTRSLATTTVSAAGAKSASSRQAAASSAFNCFYVYGTVSGETTVNADLRRGKAEIASAAAQAAPFAPDCAVYAPVYRQVTLAGLAAHPDLNVGTAESVTAYDSIRSGFEAFLARDDGRPFVVIGDSQGAAMLNMLLARLVDGNAALRGRLVLAIILGGNVEVPDGQLAGGTFKHIPVCSRDGQDGCVIAYSSFPSTPPPGALFGRPGQGVSLQSGQTATAGLQVACVNPADLSGAAAPLDPVFPVTNGSVPTPWVAYPDRYTGSCETADGASWLQVTAAAGDARPAVTENDGPLWGYHVWDLPLAQGNLVSDVTAAERTWTAARPG